MREIQRDIIIVQTLHYISVQTVGIRTQLHTADHLCTLQTHTARHDQTDITGTENQYPFTNHIPFNIYITLCCSRSKDTGWAISGNRNGSPGTLAAPHIQHDCLSLQLHIALLFIHSMNAAVFLINIQHHGIQQHLDIGILQHFDKFSCIFRPGQLFFEVVQTKPVVNTLIQYTAQLLITLKYQNMLCPLLPGFQRRCQTCRPSADNDNIIFHSCSPPAAFVSPVIRIIPSRSSGTSFKFFFSSLAIIS